MTFVLQGGDWGQAGRGSHRARGSNPVSRRLADIFHEGPKCLCHSCHSCPWSRKAATDRSSANEWGCEPAWLLREAQRAGFGLRAVLCRPRPTPVWLRVTPAVLAVQTPQLSPRTDMGAHPLLPLCLGRGGLRSGVGGLSDQIAGPPHLPRITRRRRSSLRSFPCTGPWLVRWEQSLTILSI